MLVSLLAAMSMAINAEHIKYTPEDDDFWYYLDTETKTASLSSYRGSAIDVAIPETVTYDGIVYIINRLGTGCFGYKSSITSITIPLSVKSCGQFCFEYCN